MRISITHDGHTVDLDISGLPEDANLRDLTNTVFPEASTVHIDGETHPLETPVSRVRNGSRVVIDTPMPSDTHDAVANLHAVSGPMAGHTWRLKPGSYRVGSETDIPLEGLESILTISPSGSAQWGDDMFPEGVLRTGPHRLRISSPPADTTEHPPGVHSFFNRPPRHIPHISRHPMAVPRPETVNGKPRRLSAIMVILPIVTGVAMALFFGRMMFLAFAALGPVTMIGSTIDDRRRRKKERRESEEKFEAEVDTFGRELERLSELAAIDAFATNPSSSELLLLARGRVQRLWERRAHHNDFLQAVVGYGAARWTPAIEGTAAMRPEVEMIIDHLSALPDGPVVSSFAHGRLLGIAGPRTASQFLAADLACQLAVTHGPVDLRIAIITDSPTVWDWAKWLPHVSMSEIADHRMVATSDHEITALLARLRRVPQDEQSHVLLLVIDHHSLDDDHLRTVRDCLSGVAGPMSGVWLVETPEDLPAACTEVIELGDNPRFRRPHAGTVLDAFDPAGIGPHIALDIATALAPLQDPEASVVGAGLPHVVRLLDLLGLPRPGADEIEQRWSSSGHAPRISAPVGVTETGIFSIDLIKDGPHGLLAGTTGSGKSELLRTLVVSMAMNVSPDHLTFVLVDYKGGAAFDACADLPHVVGVVTDLDENVGRRALLSLEAELHYREQRLRDIAVTDIDEYWNAGPDPLPRVVVVVDEFATLAKEHPDFMDALVDIAQRGRSLGVHLLLATQRPAGVIKDSIRANMNLRLSLRVQTATDSKDVLNAGEAAALPRSLPGRGFARLGPGELVAFQTALSSTSDALTESSIRVRPFVFAMVQPQAPKISFCDNGPTDLTRLVSAIRKAFQIRGSVKPRRPWTDPLPSELSWEDLPPSHDALAPCIGLVDQPSRQRHSAWSWRPYDDGNLLLVGIDGCGPTDALLAIANSLGAANDSDQVHIYGIDHGSGQLAPLESLPHVGAIIEANDTQRQMRLLRYLRAEIDRRRSSPGPVTTVLLLDGIAGFKASFDDQSLVTYRDLLQEIAASGPPHGIFVAATADQYRVVPTALAGSLSTRLVFTLADRLEYAMLGVKGVVSNLPRCRAIDPITQEHIQVATVTRHDLAVVASSTSVATRTPEQIGSLSSNVTISEIIDAGSISEETWTMPIGIEDMTLSAATIRLYPGDHFMVIGPNRSGRTTALNTVATIMRKLSEDIRVIAICPRSSELVLNPAVDVVVKSVNELAPLEAIDIHTLILVDDAEEVEDGGVLARIVEGRNENFTIVAAVRTDALRSSPRPWIRSVRVGRRGVILKPFDGGDGDVLGVRLPRTAQPIDTPGRGYLIENGTTSLVQIAR